MSVAQQALKSEENVLDVAANSEFSAGYPGIYRLSRSSAGAYRLLPLCPDDTREQRAFAAIESFGQKSNATLTDQDAFDYVSISVNPVRARANIDELTTEIGVTFDGIPRSKRVVEGYSVAGQKRAITSADDILDSAYVEGGVAKSCSGNIADSAKFARLGKPVYVFEIAKADKIYTALVNLPKISASAAKGVKKGTVEFVLGKGWTADAASNAVFGVKYFGIGPHKSKAIPVTNF